MSHRHLPKCTVCGALLPIDLLPSARTSGTPEDRLCGMASGCIFGFALLIGIFLLGVGVIVGRMTGGAL